MEKELGETCKGTGGSGEGTGRAVIGGGHGGQVKGHAGGMVERGVWTGGG